MLKRPGEVLKVGSARRDLFEIARHLGRTTRPAADRFLAAADATFARLATFPELGAPWIDNDPELSSIRCASVDGFRSHIVYYRPIPEGIEILRVAHSARDIRRTDLIVNEDG